jgi:hypothetical protein
MPTSNRDPVMLEGLPTRTGIRWPYTDTGGGEEERAII